jgi:succinoglycan biosynthesis transport protein ExoP
VAESTDSRSSSASIRDFLTVAFRHKWIIIAVVAVTVGVTILTAVRAAPVYESFSKLLVSRGQTTTAYSSNLKLLSWEEELSSELEAIRSAKIFKRAQEILDEQGATDSTGASIRIDPAKVNANTPGKSHVIHIIYRAPAREVVRPIVGALTQAYQEFRSNTRGQDPTEFLDVEISRLRTEIADWERRRADFLMREGAVELPQERQNILATKRSLEVQLAEAAAEIAERQARVQWMEGDMLAEPSLEPPEVYPFGDPYGRGEPAILVLRKLILNTRAEYIEAKAQYTDNHPRVLALRERVEELEAAMSEESEAYIGYMTAQLQVARAKAASLEASLDYINQQLREFPDREAQLSQLDRTIESLRTTHDALVRRRADALTLRLGSMGWDVVVLQEAVPPFRVGRLDYVRLAVIPIFALLVSIGLAFLLDSLDQTFREVKEVETYLRVPSLAAIHRFRK